MPELPASWTDLRPEDPDRVPPRVEAREGGLDLRFDEAVLQSRMRLDSPWQLDVPYTRFMMAALLWQPRPARVLVIGLGGGSLPRYILHTLPEAEITAVEINPHVIACRERFLLPPDGSHFQVVEVDGAQFLAEDERRWDWILVDAFNADGQAPTLCTPDAYARMQARVAPGGLAAVNLEADDRMDRCYLDRMATAFGHPPCVLVLPGGGNQVALAGPAISDPPPTLRGMRRALAELAPVHRATLQEVTPVLMRVLGRL